MGVKTKEQLLELPKEIRAFINQQVAEFAPFCLPDSGVSINVEKESDETEGEEYIVTIMLSGGGAEVKSTAQDGNIFEATKQACQSLLEHLYVVQRQMIEEMEKHQAKAADQPATSDAASDPASDVISEIKFPGEDDEGQQVH